MYSEKVQFEKWKMLRFSVCFTALIAVCSVVVGHGNHGHHHGHHGVWITMNRRETEVRAMSVVSDNPGDGLPNQEKNQYRTVYWWETGALYTIKKLSDHAEEGKLK